MRIWRKIRLASDFNEFKEYIKDKRAAVVGIGVSNTPLIKMLVRLGARVNACDKKSDIGGMAKELRDMGVNLYLGEGYLEGTLEADIIFRTPSMRPDNPYLKKAKERGAYVTSEMAEFIKYCPCNMIGVTGSDGKTTTTTLIYEMFLAYGKRVFLGGNIGNPLFYRIEDIGKDDYVVAELSSFQLMDVSLSPNISIVTNLSPNHLDIHKDMEEYIESKKNIFLHQDEKGLLILNKDNEITNSMIKEAKGEVRTFSLKNKDAYAHLEGENLFVNGKRVCSIDEVKLPGMHNIDNLLTAFAAVDGYVSIEAMRDVATTFMGVEHRIEFVREINGVKFYNDSIASSPTRVVAGLKSFNQKVILIAGGYDKMIPFDELAKEGLEKIKALVLMGLTKKKIRDAFENEMKLKNKELTIIEADSLEDAVNKAYEISNKGDIITLSPSCASFDMFKNFEDRGNKFKEIVMNLK